MSEKSDSALTDAVNEIAGSFRMFGAGTMAWPEKERQLFCAAIRRAADQFLYQVYCVERDAASRNE